eukprot:Gb_21503 [translate_table: standard]
MGGDPITTKPAFLVVDKEVRNILEEVGLLVLFKKFKGHSESITNQFVDTWKDGRVVIDKIEILVNVALIVEVLGLPNDGEVISREKMNQGRFTRVSRTPITKAQLLLVLILTASHIDFGDSVSEAEGELESQEKVSLIKNPKDKGGRKRKLPAQVLSAILAKCSRRSSRLQRKSTSNPSLLDMVETFEEERKLDEPSLSGGKKNPQKGFAATPFENVKSPGDPLLLTEELICHLRVLNSLGSPLSSMCACVNLLALEIMNYLKKVLKFMKEKNVEKE